MYNLLLVDDEEIILLGLYDLFTNLPDIELDVYKAYSAYEALSVMEKVRIDILITDIQMPDMDGIEFVKKAMDYWPKCKVIFLTGHKNEEYLMAAIRYRVVDFVLKYENDSVLIRSLNKAINLLDEDNLRTEETEVDNHRESIYLREKLRLFYNDLCAGTFNTDIYNQQDLDELGIPLDITHPVLLICAGYLKTNQSPHNSVQNMALLDDCFIIHDQFSHFVRSKANFTFTIRDEESLVWLLQPLGQREEERSYNLLNTFLKGTLESVQECCEKFYIEVTFSIYSTPLDFSEIPESYAKLRQMIMQCQGIGKGLVLSEKTFDGENTELQYVFNEFYSQINGYKTNVLKLIIYLERGYQDEYFEVFHNLTCKLQDSISMNFLPALELYYAIAVELLRFINLNNIIEHIVYKVPVGRLLRAWDFGTWNEAIQYLINVSHRIFEIRAESGKQITTNIVATVKLYIQNNLAKDLSLITLSEKVKVNPQYLSRQFKKSEGRNLSRYITEVKINKAKELLAHNSVKIFEIAQMLGFESNSYFAKFFRRETGLSPLDYRNNKTA